MIQLFIYTLARFLIVALAAYFAFILFKWIVRAIQKYLKISTRYPNKQEFHKPKEPYKDVRDAKFVDSADKPEEIKSENNI